MPPPRSGALSSNVMEARVADLMSKLTLEELKLDAVYEATLWQNPEADSRFPLRATHLDGRRAPKVVLANDARIVAGIPCRVRVTDVTKPDRTDHGYIEVVYEGP